MHQTYDFTYTLDEIEQVAEQIIDKLEYKLVVFEAEMGSGKTTLIKSILKKLGSTDLVSSPTFSLVNEYETSGKPAYHFDFYRLKNTDEALDTGFLHYLEEDAWLLVEWPQKIMHFLPEHYHLISLKPIDDKTRTVSLWTL